jgi:solute carrier family 25 (mitochondrial adenine nucleotide translocator), member 4/5/6/31
MYTLTLTIGFSGILAKTVVAPIERVKLLLQTQKVNSRIAQTKHYSGGISCLKDIIEKEGVMALWRGNTANVIRYFPNQAFNFALKDKFRRFLGLSTVPNGEGGQKNMQMAVVFWNNIIAGSAAGATTSLVTYPLDMARTRLATDVTIAGSQGGGQRQFQGVWDCVRQSYVEGGLARVYRGFPLSIGGGKAHLLQT